MDPWSKSSTMTFEKAFGRSLLFWRVSIIFVGTIAFYKMVCSTQQHPQAYHLNFKMVIVMRTLLWLTTKLSMVVFVAKWWLWCMLVLDKWWWWWRRSPSWSHPAARLLLAGSPEQKLNGAATYSSYHSTLIQYFLNTANASKTQNIKTQNSKETTEHKQIILQLHLLQQNI